MSKMVSEQEYLRRVAALPREIAPATDAWPHISARLSHASGGSGRVARRTGLWPYAAAASLVFVFAAGLLLERSWTEPPTSPSSGDSAMSLNDPGSGSYDFAPNAVGELEYRAALREFMALDTAPGVIEGPKPRWIAQGWGTLRKVELELSNALRSEPDNAFLKSRLAALRARQIELLRQIAAVDQASRRNTI